MNNGTSMLATLRQHRPLLLGCEAIGWLHMTGKAHADFLRKQGGVGVGYDDLRWHEQEKPPFPWSEYAAWLKSGSWNIPQDKWPSSLTDFLIKHRASDDGMLGLLQAGHGIASGIEKNVPTSTSEYLKQDATHMWLSSPFGHPVRNLLVNPPRLLASDGWDELVERVAALLEKLKELGSIPCGDPNHWWRWREDAIGPSGWLRQAFLSTVAETRVPNNDVTLWDQSYVAAALFKSAVAGAVLVGNTFEWGNNSKQQTRWRVLTVGFGTRHYEARAVKIGDWVGAQRDIEGFFERVRKFIEVDLAIGSLVYRDDETVVFTFPGQREDGKGSLDDNAAEELRKSIAEELDQFAQELKFETPPLCRLSQSTRSVVPMVHEQREVRKALAVPIHRPWEIKTYNESEASGTRHVCPVCLTRLNEPPRSAQTDNARKSYLCGVCRERRRGRLDAWLSGEDDTIWISEVADENDRVALLTVSFDIDPWLEGEHVDSLRAQNIASWQRFNPVLEEYWKRDPNQRRRIDNPLDPERPFASVMDYVKTRLASFEKDDLVLANLQEGYRHERSWDTFFAKIVEDRANAPQFANLTDDGRANWLAHQLFRKLPSPGRVYRFWRTTEAFFDELFKQFREIAASHPNPWRRRRLRLAPDTQTAQEWEDRETYAGRWNEGPFEVLYRTDHNEFLSIGNLSRCLEATDTATVLQEQELELKGDDGQVRKLKIQSTREPERLGIYAPVTLLERTPRRFRVLVPLDRVTPCIEAAIAKWREEFARVWDRMPLRIGVVAFPRLTPFQAVIEAARNLEDALDRDGGETWRVLECRTREGITALSLKRKDGATEAILVPVSLPDGREDVFYSYVRLEDRALRFPRDFQHPNGQVYRHMADLRPGDGIRVEASRIAGVFLDTTSRRFETPRVWPLADFERMQATWDLLVRNSPSLTALRGAWSQIEEKARNWCDNTGSWSAGSKEEWLRLARAILSDRLELQGAALEALVDAAGTGILAWVLEWHLTWLKVHIGG
ncbi:MAG: CRISPR-associated protein Csx11 [bacterium]